MHKHISLNRKRKRTRACHSEAGEADDSTGDSQEVQPSTERQPTNASEQDTPASSTDPKTVDWREFRARLVAGDRGQQGEASTSTANSRWAHDVGKPERGCLLLAHPLMFGSSQGYFSQVCLPTNQINSPAFLKKHFCLDSGDRKSESQAVIFLFEHDNTASAGFILNKPTEHVLGKLVGADNLCPEFADNVLYLGGDVGHDTMHFLHGYSDIQGAVEVVQGVFMGGFEEARFGIRTGSKQSDQFRWFNRYAGWGPGQLEAECAAGVWFTAAASSDVILNQQNLSGREMWHTILEMMGGDYAALSKNVRDAYPENLPSDP
ncbi:TPA: hypothetical protein ACH3X3_008476 [Trebouxia sp. C0006]